MTSNDGVPCKDAYTLFLCHLLSTWNARTYEYAAVLFTAAAYPQGLGPTSLIGITTSLAVILFASSLGRWIDHAPSRLKTLITTFTVNRCAVIAACVCWFVLLTSLNEASVEEKLDILARDIGITIDTNVLNKRRTVFFIIILALGVVERLSRVANLLSLERDWVPVLAPPSHINVPQTEFDLTLLNVWMSRIDLICKLASPIVLGVFMSTVGSPKMGVIAVACSNFISWYWEFWSARRVWGSCERLRRSKRLDDDGHEIADIIALPAGDESIPKESATLQPGWLALIRRIIRMIWTLYAWLQDYWESLARYFGSDVWMPSIALSCAHFSILSYSATFTVYLLSSGFPLSFITLGQALSSFFEIGSTFIFAWGVRALSPAWEASHSVDRYEMPEANERIGLQQEEEDGLVKAKTQDLSTGISIIGFWALFQMFLSLALVIPAIWQLSEIPYVEESSSVWRTRPLIASALLLFVSFSRLGRWTNHLSTQQLAQTIVPLQQRSSFAGTEASFASLFGLGHWITTAIWSRHEDFRWLAIASVGAVTCSTILYGFWLMSREGTRVFFWRRGPVEGMYSVLR